MRRVTCLLLALLCLLLPSAHAALEAPPSSLDPAQPHRSTDAVKKALSAVIESQLAAFRVNDYEKAFTFAAAEIQGMFSAAQFEEMVKKGYPVIAQSTSAEFGLAFDAGDEAVVSVTVVNAAKKSVTYQYHLTKQKGAWRIGGVQEVETSGGNSITV